jgi:starch synthase
MKIAYVSYEVAPFAKVGGLADIAGALPKYLKKIGEDVFVIMPLHKRIKKNYDTKIFEKVVEEYYPITHNFKEPFNVLKSNLPNSDVPIYFIESEVFNTEEVYEDSKLALGSTYFSDAVLTFIREVKNDVEVININDWQTSLIPVYMRHNYISDPTLSKISTVLTIHNLGYQGIFGKDVLDLANLPGYLYNTDALEFFGDINFLKGAILYSDIINTVSKTYAEEIQSPEMGEKLDGVLRIRSDNLYGILNGIDYSENDPKNDDRIFNHIHNYKDKVKNKLKLQKYLNLEKKRDRPVISLISRLYDQKGLDLIFDIMDYVMMLDVNFVVLGTGDKKYEKYFEEIEEKYPGRASANLKFDVDLAQKIYAGSDIFLMPSKYEPCGLGQMFSMRYGTVPVVRYTGGLSDTVVEFDEKTEKGNGFGFFEYESCKLLKAVLKATYYYKMKPEKWEILFNNCMGKNFSMESTASQYRDLYKMALTKKRGAQY